MLNLKCGCSFKTNENNRPIVDPYNLNLECEHVWKLICSGEVNSCFQIESDLGKIWCKKVKPRSITELSHVISICRPGVLESIDSATGKTLAQTFVDIRDGIQEPVYIHEALKPILSKTYSVILYQEQVIEICKNLAGFNLQEADAIRKSMGKKLPEEMAKCKIKFLDGCKSVGIVNEDVAKEIFSWIEKSQRYLFNFSHGISYSYISYQSAYMKYHFMPSFIKSCLKESVNEQDPILEMRSIIDDCKKFDIEINPPTIKSINSNFHFNKGKIYFGLANIKGIGDKQVEKISELLKDINIDSLTWYNFLINITRNINSTVVKNLIRVGALPFKMNRNRMLKEYSDFSVLTSKELEWVDINKDKYDNLVSLLKDMAKTKKNGGGCHNEKRVDTINSMVQLLENPASSLEDSIDWIVAQEKELISTPITYTKVDSCDLSDITCSCKEYLCGKSGYLIFGVEIVESKVIIIKNGKSRGMEMCFLKISDSSASLDSVTVFPEQFLKYKPLLFPGNTVKIRGERDKKRGSLIVKIVQQI